MTNETKFIGIPFFAAWMILLAFIIYAVPYNLRAQDQGEEGTTQQEPARVTDPEHVVIFNFRAKQDDPLVNMRVVIRAKSEADAIVRATLFLNKQFGSVIDMDKLRFVEVGPAPGTAKKDEKK